MSKYCRPMGLYVTYLDCMECEDKECITKREEQTNVSMEEQLQRKIASSAQCMEGVNSQKGEQEGMKKVYQSVIFHHPLLFTTLLKSAPLAVVKRL